MVGGKWVRGGVLALILAGLTSLACTSTAAPPKPTSSGPPATGQPAARPEAAAESFYRGKTLRLVVGAAPGGGFDTYARIIARHWGRHIPGGPVVVVENMPAAGGLVAANHTYNVAPKDGTVVVSFNGHLASRELFGGSGVEFQFTRFQFLGTTDAVEQICLVSRASGFSSLAEARDRELTFGSNAPGTNIHDVPVLLRETLGLKIKIVSGYGGQGPILLAVDQGEVDGVCSTWQGLRALAGERIQAGDYRVIVQVTEKAIPELSNVPVAMELATSETSRQMLRYGSIQPSQFQRTFALPPGVPAERVQVLRQAFAAMLDDPEFVAEADRAKLGRNPISGEEYQRLAEDYFRMPEDVKARLKAILAVD